jgi:hypothetical protein
MAGFIEDRCIVERGVQASGGRLRATDWPDDAKHDAEPARGIHRDVLRALKQKHGVKTSRKLPQAALALVATLYRHEKRCRLAERYLRIEKDLPLADRLRLLEVIGAATESRDKALERLGLGLDSATACQSSTHGPHSTPTAKPLQTH